MSQKEGILKKKIKKAKKGNIKDELGRPKSHNKEGSVTKDFEIEKEPVQQKVNKRPPPRVLLEDEEDSEPQQIARGPVAETIEVEQEKLLAPNDSKEEKKKKKKQKNLENNTIQKSESTAEVLDIRDPDQQESQKKRKLKLKSLSICIPDSIISIAQSSELRSYFISQLSRFFAIFCVDEIIILKDQTYFFWLNSKSKSPNFDATGYIARNLQYLETPQYLRKNLFPIHPDLKNAGLMNPIECKHHLKFDEFCEYREGVIVNRPVRDNDQASWVEIGLKKQAKVDFSLQPGTRVTVKLKDESLETTSKYYSASVVSQTEPKEQASLYWGYSVRVANHLNEVFRGHSFGKNEGYTLKVLMSKKGEPFKPRKIAKSRDSEKERMLILFEGYDGIDSLIEGDEHSKITSANIANYFDYIFTVENESQGVKSLRLEEELFQTLSNLRNYIK